MGPPSAPVVGPPSGVHQCRIRSRCTRRHRIGNRRAALAFREVRVFEVREVLRLWVRGKGLRCIEELAGVDRKTVRRYVEAATKLGLSREGGEGQLSDGLMAMVVEAVRPHRFDGHGEPWRALVSNHEQVKAWLEEGLTAVKVTELLSRRGVVVPRRTVQRYAQYNLRPSKPLLSHTSPGGLDQAAGRSRANHPERRRQPNPERSRSSPTPKDPRPSDSQRGSRQVAGSRTLRCVSPNRTRRWGYRRSSHGSVTSGWLVAQFRDEGG